jgi:hypothetical protein
MYRDLKEYCWGLNMKKKFAKFVAKYRICHHVKMEYQKPIGKLQPFLIS